MLVRGRWLRGRGTMSFSSLAGCLLSAAMVCACTHQPWPDPPPVDRAAFISEHAAWRLKYQQSVRDSWVELAGLWLLSEGRTVFGTDSSLPIVLPGSGPRRVAGTFVRHGRAVYVEPAGSDLRLGDEKRAIVPSVALHTDNDSVTSVLHSGSYHIWIHVVEDRYYVRARDTASPHLTGFTLAPEYEPDPRWRVAARFNAYKDPRILRLADI